jgi:apolipoprotein D and lipocalin family protein
MLKIFVSFSALFFAGCYEPPPSVKPVVHFDANRYLGKWFEVARLDNSFERGFDHTTAEYALRSDGGIRVVNRGYNSESKKWKTADGRAYFVKDASVGHLRVSFFRPFYGAYAVFELDSNYQYAFVSGGDLKYLWLLSRTPVIDKTLQDRFIAKASALGFATDKLLWVKQTD